MPEQFHDTKEPSGEGKPHKPFESPPFLFIRYNKPDRGDRGPAAPIKQPGANFWTSPDILVSPTDGLGNVMVGTDVTITARVWNKGGQAAQFVTVEFWVFNPSLALTAANSLFTATSSPISVPGALGSVYHVDVVCPKLWKPTFENNGHECIIVQCKTPEEGSDNLKYPFFPVLDRHVGQHNITVARPLEEQWLQVLAGNAFERPLSFTFRLSSLLVQGDFEVLHTKDDVGTLMTLLAQAQVGSTSLDPGKHRLAMQVEDISEKDLGVSLQKIGRQEVPGDHKPIISFETFLQQHAERSPDFNPQRLGRVLDEFTVEPGLAIILVITVPPINLGENRYVVHHLTQVVENYEVSGYTLVVPPANF